jgi:hypothetical protein
MTVATSFGSGAMLTEAFELGITAFFTKPVPPNAVAESLEGNRELPTVSLFDIAASSGIRNLSSRRRDSDGKRIGSCRKARWLAT